MKISDLGNRALAFGAGAKVFFGEMYNWGHGRWMDICAGACAGGFLPYGVFSLFSAKDLTGFLLAVPLFLWPTAYFYHMIQYKRTNAWSLFLIRTDAENAEFFAKCVNQAAQAKIAEDTAALVKSTQPGGTGGATG